MFAMLVSVLLDGVGGMRGDPTHTNLKTPLYSFESSHSTVSSSRLPAYVHLYRKDSRDYYYRDEKKSRLLLENI